VNKGGVSTLTCALTARQLARRARVDGGVRRRDGPASGTVVGTADGDRASAASGLPVVWWARAETGEGGWWRGLVLTHLGLGEWNRWDDDDDDVFVFPQSNWAETGRASGPSFAGNGMARPLGRYRTVNGPNGPGTACQSTERVVAGNAIPPPRREDAIADVAELKVWYYR
jgi:hypothetical protein